MRSHQCAGDNTDAEPIADRADRFIIREEPVGSETQPNKKANLR